MQNNNYENYEVKSEYDSSFAFLGRINHLLFLATKTSVEHNPEAYYDVLERLYIEVSPYLNIDKNKPEVIEIESLIKKTSSKTPKLLKDLDIKLRIFLFEKNILTRIMDDPNKVILR